MATLMMSALKNYGRGLLSSSLRLARADASQRTLLYRALRLCKSAIFSNKSASSFSGSRAEFDDLRVALWKLDRICVPVRGPFVTPERGLIFLVDGCVLTKDEVVALHENGESTSESVANRLSDLRTLQTSTYPRKRRSERVMFKLGLLVRVEMPRGGRRETHAVTVKVNAHGGLLGSSLRMSVGQKITLINPQSKKEVNCRVVSVTGPSAGSFDVAFEFYQPSPWFWSFALPPLDWAVAAANPA